MQMARLFVMASMLDAASSLYLMVLMRPSTLLLAQQTVTDHHIVNHEAEAQRQPAVQRSTAGFRHHSLQSPRVGKRRLMA